MKMFFFLTLVSVSAFAQITLEDFGNVLQDVRYSRQSKESLFQSLNRTLVRTKDSICSNRALIWNYDLTRLQKVDSAKMYLFYTGKTGTVGRTTWWYHVTPVINEGNQLWALDGGFPGMIDGPLRLKDWFEKFVGDANCKQIRAGEDDLIELMNTERVFPSTTRYGNYSCYYVIAPKEYWTPATVSRGLLGQSQRSQFSMNELMQACSEASTSRFGGIFGNNKKKCSDYLNYGYYQ